MNFRRVVQDYFTFTRSERKGIVVLLTLIFILTLANRLVFVFEKPATLDSELYAAASLRLGEQTDSLLNLPVSRKLFPFNPNTIDSLAAVNLDIPLEVRLNLFRFRARGGRFFAEEDLRKIYGMNDSIFERVRPFIVLGKTPAQSKYAEPETVFFRFDPNIAGDDELLRLGFSESQLRTFRKYQEKGGTFKTTKDFLNFRGLTDIQKEKLKDYVTISTPIEMNEPTVSGGEKLEINQADSVQWKQLPGIGEKLSKRIVKYRDLLGGFYSVDQLTEVYGLSDETFQLIKSKITVDKSLVKKVDLNFGSRNDLGRHPYIGKNVASKIIGLRSKLGMIKNPEILKDSMILNIDQYQKLLPYL